MGKRNKGTGRPEAREAKPKRAVVAKHPRSKPRQLSRTKARGVGRDEKGPLGWLAPDLESAYAKLVPRGTGGVVAAASTGVPIKSSIAPERETTLGPVHRTVWRELLSQYKQRKASAARARAALPAAAVPGGRNWLPLGPTVVLNGQTIGHQPVAGRVSGLAIAPGGQILYAATANGGVFRSDDGGTSWRAVMDGFDLDPTNFASASVVCGAITLDPADPGRVYVGTGEGDTDRMFREGFRVTQALPAYRGIGPIRTDDGGTKWAPEDSNPDLAGESFFALAVDPRNRENVIGATTNGLYRRVAKAGGKFQWDRQREGIHSSVVAASAGGITRFVAAEWGKGVVHSTDGGQVWGALGSGFPSSGVGRIALGVQADDPNLVYALAADDNGVLLGLYRLDGAGGSWKKVSGVPNILFGRQGDYDLTIAVAPGDANTVYLGGDRTNSYPFSGNIQRCVLQAAGGGYSVKSSASIGTQAHADVHVLVHTPGDPTELWCGCDGGVFLNRDPKGSGQFSSQNSGLACLCTNFLAQHPTDPNILFSGLQDNGTARTTAGPIWTHVQDGDGGYCAVNWADPRRVLVYMGGSVFRSSDGGATFDDQPVWDAGGDTMTLPVVTAPYNPQRPADADIVAVGAAGDVYLSSNFGTSWPASQRITLPPNSGSVFALAFASTTRLFIGTTNGSVFRAERGGNTWSLARLDTAAAGPLGLQGLITDVAVDWADVTRASVYVAFGGQGDDRRRVWRFNGTKWEARSGPDGGNNLLNVEHNALAVDSVAPDNVYAASDIGVWHSPDRGLSWEPLENGLPDAPVYDLQIHPTQRLLRAATHGRGLFELPLT
jgi:photosystem II stability/assembly factor-like uncharacterized protein